MHKLHTWSKLVIKVSNVHLETTKPDLRTITVATFELSQQIKYVLSTGTSEQPMSHATRLVTKPFNQRAILCDCLWHSMMPTSSPSRFLIFIFNNFTLYVELLFICLLFITIPPATQVIRDVRLCYFGQVAWSGSAEDHCHAISAALNICPNHKRKRPPGRLRATGRGLWRRNLFCCTLASTRPSGVMRTWSCIVNTAALPWECCYWWRWVQYCGTATGRNCLRVCLCVLWSSWIFTYQYCGHGLRVKRSSLQWQKVHGWSA